MKIKTEETIRKKDLEKYYQTLVDQINAEIANVKKKVNFYMTFTGASFLLLRLRNRKLLRSRRSYGRFRKRWRSRERRRRRRRPR